MDVTRRHETNVATPNSAHAPMGQLNEVFFVVGHPVVKTAGGAKAGKEVRGTLSRK